MQKRSIRVGAVAAAACAAVLLAGGSALASPSASAAKMTGPEAITGAAYGAAAIANVTPIPLTFAGVVATTDRGFKLGPGGGKEHTLATPDGKLAVAQVGAVDNKQTLNAKTCFVTYTSTATVKFVPGMSTGKFAGATGPGAYQVYFGAYLPRYTSGKHKGECNTSNSAEPLAKGAVATFLAVGVLTVG